MKRLYFAFFLVLLLISLSGCQSPEPDDVFFYYCRDPQQYQYFEENSVICREYRDLTGHQADLQYMAGLYLAGPMEEGLTAPFTKSTRLLSIQKNDSSILVELSDHAETMTDAEFSLSCACLSMTCMDYFPCDEVTVTSGSRSITMNRDNIVLLDSLPNQESNGG